VAPAHGFTNGMTVQITGVLGMLEVNQSKAEAYVVQGATTNTFQLYGSLGGVIDSTLWGVYTSGGTVKQVTNQVTGMSYLLGNEVVAVGDNALIMPRTFPPTLVTDDTVTFPYYANRITIGIPYDYVLQPTNPVLSSQGATTRGMPQKLNRVTLSLYQAMNGEYGQDLDHMYDISYARPAPPALHTEEVTVDMDDDWSEESTFYVRQGDPLPFTLRGIVFRMSANQD
jgi:hypothetical protein